jgi:hypothetical protein
VIRELQINKNTMKKLNEIILELESYKDGSKFEKDILLIRLKDCREEIKKQLNLCAVG